MRQSPGDWHDAASLAEAVFMARDAVEQLTSTHPSAPVVCFHEIYRYATDPAQEPGEALARALVRDPRVRDDLRRLLARSTALRPMSRAAASSGAITTRGGTGFHMTLRESRANREQIYLIIRLDDAATAAPRTLFVISDRQGCRKVALPEANDGVVQLLLEAGSDLAGALCDPTTDVFLR